METKLYNCFDYNDFDDFVQKALGLEYDCVAANEWNNYSSYRSDNVLKKDYEDNFFQKYDLLDIKEALKTGDCNSLDFHKLLVYLVYHDFLPEGNYLIDVYW